MLFSLSTYPYFFPWRCRSNLASSVKSHSPQSQTHIKCSINNNHHFYMITIDTILMVYLLYPQPVSRHPWGNEHTPLQPPPLPLPQSHGSGTTLEDEICSQPWEWQWLKSPKEAVHQKRARIGTLGGAAVGDPSIYSQTLSLPSGRVTHQCVSEGPAGNGRCSCWDFVKNLMTGLGASLRKPTGDVKVPMIRTARACKGQGREEVT